jgi:hypothetical protein
VFVRIGILRSATEQHPCRGVCTSISRQDRPYPTYPFMGAIGCRDVHRTSTGRPADVRRTAGTRAPKPPAPRSTSAVRVAYARPWRSLTALGPKGALGCRRGRWRHGWNATLIGRLRRASHSEPPPTRLGPRAGGLGACLLFAGRPPDVRWTSRQPMAPMKG